MKTRAFRRLWAVLAIVAGTTAIVAGFRWWGNGEAEVWRVHPPEPEVAHLQTSSPDCAPFAVAGSYRLERFRPMGMGRLKAAPAARPHVPVPNGPPESAQITLERTNCYGKCPAYTVVLKGGGDASYSGGRFALATGDYHYKVDPKAVSCLVEAFRNADFWSLSNKYSASITDNPTYFLTLQIGGQSKTIEDYVGGAAGMPGTVRALEMAVDVVAGSKSWTQGDGDTMSKVRQAGLDIKSDRAASLLASAAEVAPIPVVVDLVEAGLPVGGSVKSVFEGEPDGPFTIEAASGRKDLALVRMLTQRGALAPPGAKERALRQAAAVADPAVVRELLLSQPDINQRDAMGRTVLQDVGGLQPYSAKDDGAAAEVVRLLLAAGADPRIAANDGQTPLHRAGDVTIARLLVQAGASLDADSSQGRPVFSNYDEDVIAYLVTAGARPDVRSPNGQTLAERAKDRRMRKVSAALKARGAL